MFETFPNIIRLYYHLILSLLETHIFFSEVQKILNFKEVKLTVLVIKALVKSENKIVYFLINPSHIYPSGNFKDLLNCISRKKYCDFTCKSTINIKNGTELIKMVIIWQSRKQLYLFIYVKKKNYSLIDLLEKLGKLER